jgi:hypothetical protein
MQAESHFARGWQRFQRAENLVAAVVIGALTAFLGLLLLHGRFPAHDTRSIYEVFHAFYNSLLQYHEMPLWFAAIEHGIPVDIEILIRLSPAQFLVAGVGWLFHARNSLALFYGASQIEMFVLGFGGYLLGRSLFGRMAPTVLLVASLLLSTFYLWQMYFDFRLFVWIPLALYFFNRFAVGQDPRALVAAGACLLLSAIGTNAYMPLPVLSVVAFLAMGLLWEAGAFAKRREFLWAAWRNLRRDWLVTGLLALACIILAGAWLSIGLHAFDYIQLASPGRQANGRVGLDVFLGYGFDPGFGKLLELLFATPANMDARFFTGYINLIFFLVALIWARRKMVFIAAACVLFLVALSLSEATMVPALFYYLIPGVDRFRHIGLLLPIARCLIFLVAAYGLEEALDRAGSAQAGAILRSLTVITGTLLALAVALGVRFGHDLPYTPVWSTPYVDTREVWTVSLLAGLLFLAALARAQIHRGAHLKWLGAAAIAAASLELGANQYVLHRGSALFPPGAAAAATVARPLSVGLWRQDVLAPPLLSADDALRQTAGMAYGTRDVFLGANRCKPYGRTDMRNRGLANLWNMMGRVVPGQPAANRILVTDPQAFPVPGVPAIDPDLRDSFIRSLLGCIAEAGESRPTLFLTRTVRLAQSEMEARSALVEVAAQRISAYPQPRIAIQASSTRPGGGYGPVGLLTGLNAWYASSPVHYPQTLTLRLDVPAAIGGLELLPEQPRLEWRPQFFPPGSVENPEPDLAGRTPAAFSFQGSANGRDWEPLFAKTGNLPAPEPPPADESPWLSWRFPNATPYRFYRLTITANSGDSDYLTLQSLRLLVAPAAPAGEGPPDTVIEAAPGSLPATAESAEQAGDRVSITGVSYNSLQADASTRSAGWLVWREGWHPGWRVWVDGQAHPLARADLGFQAVSLEAGEHRVTFRFMGNQGFAGKYRTLILLSAALFLLVLGLAVATRRVAPAPLS